jgi:hypothetical protein
MAFRDGDQTAQPPRNSLKRARRSGGPWPSSTPFDNPHGYACDFWVNQGVPLTPASSPRLRFRLNNDQDSLAMRSHFVESRGPICIFALKEIGEISLSIFESNTHYFPTNHALSSEDFSFLDTTHSRSHSFILNSLPGSLQRSYSVWSHLRYPCWKIFKSNKIKSFLQRSGY